MDRFKLPLDVKFGHLGQLTLQIPWSNLKSKPVKVFIEDVYLLASPMIIDEYDEDEEHQRSMALKKRKLEDLEIMNKSKPDPSSDLTDEDAAKNLTFTENLVTKIVDNLQVTIKNIHVRYEDDSVFTEDPYSFGFTLAELSAVSTDESWLPTFISGLTAHTNKLLTLDSFEIYMNTEFESIYSEDTDELLENFAHVIEQNSAATSETQYLLKPVSGSGHLTVNKRGLTSTEPHIKSELFFDEFGIDLDSAQFKDILWTASKFHWYLKTQQFRKLRPKKTALEAPLEWFKYAANCVLSEIHEKHYKWTWDHFKKRRDQRKLYVSLWKLKITSKPLSPDQQSEFDQLEEELSFEDIRFYRSIARSESRKEKLEITQASTTTVPGGKANESGWLSSWWGGSKASNETTENSAIQMTDEQRKELYDAIEYDELKSVSEAIDIPKDRVKMEIITTLKRGAMAIRKSKRDSNLAEVIFEGCQAQFYQRPDSFLACFQLQEFKVEDGTDSSLYKHIVSVEQLHSGVHSLESLDEGQQLEPFFQVSFENNPLDGSADTALSAKLRSMTIFHNPKFIEDIARFFKPPKTHLDTVGMIMSAAESTLEGLTTQTRIGLQYALEEHKTLNCKLDLQAPLIIIPLDPSDWSSPVAVLDAGHISVISDLADPNLIESVKNADATSYDETEWKKLNSLMYDRFNLHLEDAQIFIGNNIKSTIEQLHSESDKPALILDNLSIKFLLEVSILPTAYNLARFKVGADIPRFKASLNDYQYKVIMLLLDLAIPNFDFGEEDFDGDFGFRNFNDDADAQIDDIDSDTSSVISKSTASKRDSSPKSSQHLFEVAFNIDVIQLSLSRCSDTATLKSDPLVDLHGTHLHLDFYKTAFDMGVDLILSDISMDDHIVISNDPEFNKLVSTNYSVKSDSSSQVEDLLKLKYRRTQRIVEFNDKEIEVFDQDVDMNIAAIKLIITRKSVLTLLNFILNTFTDPNPPETPADELRHNADDEETAPQKMTVNLKLESIMMILNDDGIKLATLQLSEADVNVFMVPEKMKVSARLGGFTLHDDINEANPIDSVMRQLISIEGNELAEFVYETFDNATNINSFNSLVKFHTGSMKINFIEAPFTQIMNFLSTFQQMKYIYDSAREAALNQANNLEDANKMHFDVLIKTPIIILPKIVDAKTSKFDAVTMNLGEIYLTNEFETRDGIVLNMIESGIRSTRIVSDFFFDEVNQRSEIISDLNVLFHVDYAEKYVEDRPTMIITGEIDGSEIKLTECQAAYLLQMLQSVSRVFSNDDAENPSLAEIEDDAANANLTLLNNSSSSNSNEVSPSVELEPLQVNGDHCKIDFKFDVSNLSMTLYNNTKGIADITKNGLTRFSLHNTGVNMTVKEDGNYKAELHVKSFIVEDIREIKDNKFTKIIPEIEHDSNQFMASIYSEGKEQHKYTYAMLSIDSPKTILALDYLFAMKLFMDVALTSDNSILPPSETLSVKEVTQKASQSRKASTTLDIQTQKQNKEMEEKTVTGSFGFTVNVVNSSVILLADPSAFDSEAIVFKAEQLLITSQNIMSLSASNIGMFLCRMDNLKDNRLRIIDDFSASLTIDSRDSTSTSFLTQIEASVDMIVMRLSLRDIRLAMSIFNKASSLYEQSLSSTNPEALEADDTFTFTKEFKNKLSQYAPTIISTVSSVSRNTNRSSDEVEVTIKNENLLAEIQGLRLVLIGDVHELPLVDMNVNPFRIEAKNWSTDLEADTSIESFINIFNYSTSSWEPFIEPWPITCHVSKVITNKRPSLMVDIGSKQLAELTMSSRSIALLSNVFSLLSDETELKPRGENSPYRVLNQTGYEIEIWIDDGTENMNNLTRIKNNETIPWHFEDWKAVRESLSVDSDSDLLGLRIVDSPYQEVHKISLKSEGEQLFMLQPPVAKVHNRLSCEIKLHEDKVKHVVLKSTVTVKNDTLVPIFIKNVNDQNFPDLHIEAGGSCAIPIDAVYADLIRIRPDLKTQFEWSETKVHWKDLLSGTVSMVCPSSNKNELTNFFFQLGGQYDDQELLAKIYPHMNIIVSSPIEIENLLPFDISYRIYDKSHRKDWRNYLKKGSTSPVHVVTLEHLLLLSCQPVDSGYEKSEFAIINSPLRSEFQVDKRMFLKNRNGQKLFINIHYSHTHDIGAGVKVTIYAPYIVLNRTGLDLTLADKNNYFRSMAASSTETQDENGEEEIVTKYPDMFSFERPDRSNRVVIRAADSAASKPVGFDAIGQSVDLTVPVYSKQTEINLGLTITEGEGVYKLTKVITICPRYVIKNNFEEAIQIREVGSSKDIVLQKGESQLLYNLRHLRTKQLMFRFVGNNSQWSSPFNMTDIGQIHLKILKQNVGHILLKVGILVEDATLFININDAKNQWPFSMRNFSDEEIIFYQSDPNVDENGVPKQNNQPPFKPIYYRLPLKSVMPYSWDYPAGGIKELIIRSHGRERHIQLAEIGNLRPMRLPATDSKASAIIDLNVVADGPTQTLVITNYDPSTSMYKLKSQQSSSTNSLTTGDKFEANESDDNYYSKVIVRLEGLGISLINHHLQELCYVTFRGIELRYNESDIYQNFSVKLKWIQIDNQIFGSVFPMVLYPSVLPQSTKEMENHPTFSGAISKVKDDTHGVLFIKYATVLLQEMSVEIDEDFLLAVLDFAKLPGASWNKEVVNKLWDENLKLPEPTLVDASEDVYFEALHFQPLQMNLSFVRTDKLSEDDRANSNNPLMFFLNVLTMAIGNINDAPVRLNALFLENVKVPIPILLQMIQSHYGQAFLYQVHKILGSADVLGNPVGLFNNISSGFMDIFYEPYQGFIMNDRPQELGIGIAKGGLSFLKKSVFGFSDSVAKFTGSVSKGLSVVTLDKEFQERRRLNKRRNKPNQTLYNFSNGASSFVDTISSGITGIATAPIEGSRDGAAGFFKGLGKGMIGLPTKTAIGFLDLANNVSEGIRSTTTAFDKGGLEKIRLPRYIGYDNIIRPFAEREAQGQYWLKVIDGGVYFNERYLAHVVLPGDENVVLVSFDRILMFSIITLTSKWLVDYRSVRSISLENTGIKLKINDGKDGPFIPLGDADSKRFLYSKIGVAVREFNKRCQVTL